MIPKRTLILVAALLSTVFPAQDLETERAKEVARSYQKGLLAIEGVREVVVQQIGGVTTISIRAETVQARDTVALMTGNKLGSFPVRIVVSTIPFPEEGDKADPASKPPEPACTHCPIHCGHQSASLTVVEAKPSKQDPAKTDPAGADAVRTEPPPQEQCDVARKWMGLPRRKNAQNPCEEMVSWSDAPDKIRWVLSSHLPHWRSQEMPGLRGSDKTGVPCGEHGTHCQGEVVCYTWIKHAPDCPLKAKVAPADILPANLKKAEK